MDSKVKNKAKKIRVAKSELEVAKNNLKNIKRHLESVIESIAGNHWWKDVNGRYMGFNGALAKELGLNSAAEIIGKTDYEMPWSRVADILVKNDQEVMKSGVSRTQEEQVHVKDGRILTFLVTKVPLRDGEGNIIGTIGTSVDITKQKQTENALKEQIKKTEQAYHSKAEFLSIASHEIRNPVGNAINILDLLKQQIDQLQEVIYDEIMQTSSKKSKNIDFREYFQKINEHYDEVKAESYRALNALINLGDLHRLQTEKMLPRFEVYPIQELVEKAIENSIYPNTKKIDIRLKMNDTVPEEDVAIDWRNIYESLRIVIGNSIRFSKENDIVKIAVDTAQRNNDDFFAISVQDYGVGIAKTQLAHLLTTALEEEQKTETSHYRKPSLQLPQVKMRLEASGGSIEIKSVLNKGTTVTLLVPYQKKKNIVAKETHSSSSVEVSSAQKFLLIEDDVLAQKAAKRHLEALGHTVDVASTGAEAIKLATTNPYDIIWLDITLPDIDGIELMKKIRKKIGDAAPFVAVTSHASEEDVDYFISQDVMTVLTKPVTQQKFKECIENVMSTKFEEDDEDENVS